MKKSWLLVGSLALFLAACGGEEEVETQEEQEEVTAEDETVEEEEDLGLHPILANGIEEVRNWTSYTAKTEIQQEAVDGSSTMILNDESTYMKDPLKIYAIMKMGSGSGTDELVTEAFLKDGVTYVKDESGQWVDGSADGEVQMELDAEGALNKLADLMQSYVDFSTKIEELDTEFSFTIKPANSIGVLNAFMQYYYEMDFEGNLDEVESVEGQILHDGSKITGVALYATIPDSMGGPKQNLAFSSMFSKINEVTDITPEGF